MSDAVPEDFKLAIGHEAVGDDVQVTCERCGKTIAVVVVESEDEALTAAERAAVEAYEEWFERFDPEQDAYVSRCPNCVPEAERPLWVRVGDPELADHTAPGFRRSE